MAGKFTLTKALPFLCSLLRRKGLEAAGSLFPASSSRPPPAMLRRNCSSQTGERYVGSRRRVVVCDVEGGLLRSSSTFPYFMLVALESGGLLRAVLLLLLSPFLWLLGEEVGSRIMAVVCFCGVKEEGFALGRTVLPKHVLEDVGLEGLQLLLSASGEGKKKLPVFCVTSMPRVMVESTLKEYLGVDAVAGREMKVVRGYYTGLIIEDGNKQLDDYSELLGTGDQSGNDGDGVLLSWVGGRKKIHRRDQLFFSNCTQYWEEVIVVDEVEKRLWRKLPREMYKKPLHFHDGRIAFRPSFPATVAMLLWLPLGLIIILVRAVALLLVPSKFPIPILALTGIKNRVAGCPPPLDDKALDDGRPPRRGRVGRLYACNHRSLFDPVYISGMLGKTVTAVIYSVSQLTEVMSPIKVVRLEREREGDMRKMEAALVEGDLVVCPEGTTCREPYVLRFSPLFAEVAAGGVVPVAVDVRETMFRGTTATGHKWMDGFFFGLNPTLAFAAEFLDEVPLVKADGEGKSRYEVANEVQGKIAKALGFERSMLTRRDKYMVLAGTDGRVKKPPN